MRMRMRMGLLVNGATGKTPWPVGMLAVVIVVASDASRFRPAKTLLT